MSFWSRHRVVRVQSEVAGGYIQELATNPGYQDETIYASRSLTDPLVHQSPRGTSDYAVSSDRQPSPPVKVDGLDQEFRSQLLRDHVPSSKVSLICLLLHMPLRHLFVVMLSLSVPCRH